MLIEEKYNNFINRFIPKKNRANLDLYYQSFLLVSAHVFSVIFLLGFIYLHYLIKNPSEIYALSITTFIFIISFLFYPRSGNNNVFGNLIISGGFIGFLIIAIYSGGIFAPVMPWFTAISVTGFVFANKKSGFFWTVLTIITMSTFFILDLKGIKFPSYMPAENDVYNFASSFIGSAVYLILIILSYEYLNAKKNKQIERHRKELERLSIVASKTDNSIMIMNKKGDFEWVNEAFIKNTGLTLEELIKTKGKNILEANNYSEDIKRSLDIVINQKKSASFNKRIVDDHKKEFYTQMTLTPVFDEENQIKNIISIRSDVTELKEKENEIIEQNEEITQQQEELQTTLDEIEKQNKLIEQHNKELERLSIVAAKTDNAIVIMDAEGNFEWVNQAFTKETGLNLDQLIKKKGKSILEANHNSKKINTNFDTVINQKKSAVFVKRIINTQGESFHLQTTLTPILNENNEVTKIISIRSDITDLKEKEDRILQQNKLIEQRSKELQEVYDLVNNSIDYAKRIQESILSDRGILNKYFSDNFIFFKPKDKVSGDFYWWANVEDQILVTVSDCTGHGVPGAFMSLLGISYLREIVQKEYITHPGVILRKLRKEIVKALKQKGELGEQKDGMDMSLISINNETKVLQFAGANNPLYIITNTKLSISENSNDAVKLIDNNVLGIESTKYFYEIKPDKMPIGIYDRMDNFTNHEIQLQKGDKLYMFSDGFADQFGGPKNKKFKYKPFKRIILENSDLSMDIQRELLFNTFKDWKNNVEQVDDITVVGIEI